MIVDLQALTVNFPSLPQGTTMARFNKTALLGLIILTLSISSPSTAWSAEGDMILRFRGRMFSAHIQGVPLGLILKKLEREKGIWFKGTSSLLDEKVTVQFTALSLEDAMKRILASTNYSLVFNRNGKLDGVVIIGSAGSSVATGGAGTDRARRGNSSTAPKNHATTIEAFDLLRDIEPPGGDAVITERDLEIFTVMREIPPPGGSVEITPEEFEKFTVIRNCLPPGSPFEVFTRQRENFKIIRNCPPSSS